MIQSVATVGPTPHLRVLPGIDILQANKDKFETARAVYLDGVDLGGGIRSVEIPGIKERKRVPSQFRAAIREILIWLDAAANLVKPEVKLTIVPN
jgi:hypothetical protein